MPSHDDDIEGISRRAVLATTLAGAGALAGCSSDGESTTTAPDPASLTPNKSTTVESRTPNKSTTVRSRTPTQTDQPLPTVTEYEREETETPEAQLQPSSVPQAPVRGSHHPGPPRFASVGEPALGDLLHPNRVEAELSGVDGDIAPFNPVRGESFSWSIADAPADSSASLGDDPVVHFEPDTPGTYTLQLDAPDGTHELTVRVFPEESRSDPQPRVTLTGSRDGDTYVLDADAQPGPEAERDPEDLDVEFYVDDRDSEAFEGELSVEGHTATLPADAVTDTVRVHAVAVGDRHSLSDFVRIEPDGTTTHPNDPPEWIRDAQMYEIFVRRFDEDVTFRTLEDRLDYIERLGTDVIWLTPVLESHSHSNPFVPGGPHGYDITNFFDTADALGPREAYEEFVEACHDRGIRVIFDLVINHTAREHPYFQAARNGTDVSNDAQDFFYNMYEWRSAYSAHAYFGWSGIPLVDYDSLALRSWILSIVDEWQEVVDGFRCDVAWGVPRSFWKEVRDRVKSRDEEFLLLDETVPWNSEFAEDQFDIHFDYGFFEKLREAANGSPTVLHDVVADRAALGYPDHTTFVNYIENHDEDRFLALTDERSQKAAGAATFTIPGTPMIYAGQETGLTETREMMNWDAIDDDLQTHYENLAAAYDSVAALSDDAPFEPVELDDRPSGTVAYARGEGDDQALVVLNFGSSDATVPVPEGVETTDLLTDADVGAGDGAVAVGSAVILPAGDAALV